MWHSILSSAAWHNVGIGLAWVVTSCLLIAGLIGCFLPILPGHLIILIAAVAHRLMLGADRSGLEWWSFLVIILFMVISQTFEIASGAAGSKWFGGTKWGAIGAFVGSIVGLFFMPFGLLLGPLIGAFACELLFSKKSIRYATNSGIGSVVGTIAGMGMKIAIGIIMILWFFLDVFLV
ncbi:DUF456 domain-containing protein [Luteolibacter pohnpeiensis]|uniref:DUF456 domain-containing protein n=1 Tax=Luteolibacter pohnpeiensis TaxID=454153 RepID=A0A934S7G4_9BACT|nr:DUF456 domain-containing protein [Luteolibacter pohnpeiensis]MBK1881112.1 DUF456 domain-containing protein [Luteolibacter pohnpeiensis]